MGQFNRLKNCQRGRLQTPRAASSRLTVAREGACGAKRLESPVSYILS